MHAIHIQIVEFERCPFAIAMLKNEQLFQLKNYKTL
jgi:hypothetical protein